MPQSMPLCALMEGTSWGMRVSTNGCNAPFSLRLSRPLACDRLMKSGLRFTLRHKKFPLASAKQSHPSPKHHHSLHAPIADTCEQRNSTYVRMSTFRPTHVTIQCTGLRELPAAPTFHGQARERFCTRVGPLVTQEM